MAKKKSSKAGYAWVFTGTPKQVFQPGENTKKEVEQAMQPLIERLKSNLDPPPQPQEVNHPVDIFGKWNRNFYYLWEKMKTPPGSRMESFDWGIARLEHVGGSRFNMSFFRHNLKWTPHFQYENLTVEECIRAIEGDPFFYSR